MERNTVNILNKPIIRGAAIIVLAASVLFIAKLIVLDPIEGRKELLKGQEELRDGIKIIQTQIAGNWTVISVLTDDLRSMFSYLHPKLPDSRNLNNDKYQRLFYLRTGQVFLGPQVENVGAVKVTYSDRGVEIKPGDESVQVLAGASGEVVLAEKAGESGWKVHIRHAALGGLISEYRNLVKFDHVVMGQSVRYGDAIGLAESSSPACFGFAVILPGQQNPVDPLPYSPFLRVEEDGPN